MRFGKTGLFVAAMTPFLAFAQTVATPAAQKPSPSLSALHAAAFPAPQSPAIAQQIATSASTPMEQNTSANAAHSLPPVQYPQAASQIFEMPPTSAATVAVDYRQGQLSVVSERASLSAVLKLVGSKTGALIDLAPELQNEPVMAMLGPGPVREVLAELLDSPRVDYIVMGTGDTPGSLQRIVVRTRQSFARTAMASVRRPQPPTEAVAENDQQADAAGEKKLTPEQLMENWKKLREQKRLAEIEQQRLDRENEKTEPVVQPQSEPQPDNNQADNPPQR